MASQHTAEFRQEAVRVALTSGLSRKQVAADFCRWFFDVEPMDAIGTQRATQLNRS